MGQRHQIYIVEKNKTGYQALGAWHHQWTYGMRAIVNFTRLYDLIKQNTKRGFGKGLDAWCNYYTSDVRLLDSAVKATYGIDFGSNKLSMVHNETDAGYLINTQNVITPENGDNNDGCSLIIIDNVKKEVRGCMFTPEYIEGKHYRSRRDGSFKAWTREKYLSFYYDKNTQNKTDFLNEFKSRIELCQSITVKPISTIELRKIIKTKSLEVSK